MKYLGRSLTNEELHSLASLCGSAALLVAIAVFLSASPSNTFNTTSLTAATVLGDAQGVPPGYTGQTNPDYTNCWISYVYGTHGFKWSLGSLCRNNSAEPFYSGIFSINAEGTPTVGESVYANSSWIPAGFESGPLLGPPFSTLGCPDDTTMSVTSYDEVGNPASGDCYSGGGGGDGNFGGSRGTNVGPATYCYVDSSGGGLGGPRQAGGGGGGGGPPTKYSFPSGYSLANGDKLDTVGGGAGGNDSAGGVFGRVGGGGGDGQCHAWRWAPAHINSTLSPAGTLPTVDPNGQLILQWSCLPSRVVNGWGCHPSGSSWSHPFGVSCSESEYTNNVLNISPLATGASGNGTNFVSGTALSDSKTITAPSTKGIYNYTLTCTGPYALPTMTIPVDVGGVAITPAVTITGNGQSGTVAADVGTTTVNIVATFAAGEGDTLGRTALNGCTTPDKTNPDQNCQNPIAGVSNTDAATPKSYSIKPTKPGLYYFYPAVQTSLYPSWNNYGKKLTVNAQCASGTHWATGTSGGHWFDNVNPYGGGGRCVADQPPCPGGQNNPPACTTCAPFYHDNGSGVCVPNTCTDPHAVAPQCNTCASGYMMPANGGLCIPVPPTISLTLAQARVQKGTPAKLSWNVSDLSGDAIVQCSITSNPSGVFSRVMPPGTKPTWTGTNVSTGNITGTTIFTLSCTGSTPVSKTVTVIPTVEEK